MHRLGRLFMLALLVAAFPIPADAAGPDDPTQAAAAFFPPGYTLSFAQVVDLAGNGQQQAIVVVEGHQHAPPSQIAALLTRQNGTWRLAYRTPPDENARAEIYAYPKSADHPGFVVANWHFCGANCNNGGRAVVRWDGTAATVVLDGLDDRGFTNAYPASGVVLFRAPIWRKADPRCCNIDWLRRTWVWQGADLVPDSFVITGAGDADIPPTPVWMQRDGPTLFAALVPFQQAMGATSILAPLFAPAVTVQNPEGACTASGTAVASALAGRAFGYLNGLWDVPDGYNLGINLAARGGGGAGSPEARADTCRIGGSGIGGYVAHLTRSGGTFQVDTMRAVPVVYEAVPDTAIQVPPV